MANQSVLELAVSTGKWDSGLKKAKDALNNFTQAQGGLQSALKSDSDKMQQFVQMMGKMDSTAKTAKGQMNDYKGTIEALTMQYNRMTDAQKNTIGQDYLQAIDQMKQKYQAVNKELQEMNQSLSATKGIDLGAATGGGLFGGDKLSGMLQVFGGNIMTKAAGVGVGFARELGDAVKQGIELARQGEGIRIAFERLGRGDILQGLRDATHGTVTDLELMKAAVKFNDFKLPVEELGTMLAFAQQKAKDTGQSVDYMVDSIVTGLGRKSLMILDNLGLSAAEIRDKMKETGDMTKAVGEIIREQMSKAGDYVETAADRALKANVSLQNKMEELGRKFAPLKEASDNFWTSVKIKILDVVGGPLAQFLNGLTEAGRLQNALNNAKNSDRVTGDINKLKGSNYKDKVYTAMLNRYSREEQAARNNWLKSQKGGMGSQAIWENRYNEARTLREEFQRRGSAVLNPTPSTSNTPVPVEIKNTPTGSTFDASKIAFNVGEVGPNTYRDMPSVAAILGDAGMRQMLGINPQQTFDLGKDISTKWKVNKKGQLTDKTDKQERTSEEMLQGTQTMVGSLQSIVSGIEQLGIELPQGMKDVLGALQVITGIVGSIQTIITVGQFLGIFNHGGVVRAANGWSGVVPGNHYSGDTVPALLNSNELVLNQAQTSMLATKLSGNGIGNLTFEMQAAGEQLLIVANNTLKRRGKGEIATWR